MSIVYGDESREEVLVARISVINRSPVPVRVDSRFRGLFHGDSVPYGKHTIRYAVTSVAHQRLVTALMKGYSQLEVDVGASGLERV
jgi:hypothetical protein